MKKSTSIKRRIVAGMLSFTMLMYGLRICAPLQMGFANVLKAAEVKENTSKKPVALKHVTKKAITKNEKLKHTEKEASYLVITQTKEACKAIKEKCEQAKSVGTTSENHLQEENIAAVRMSGEEACSLQNTSGVLRIEEDASVKANGHIKQRKVIKKKQKSKEPEWNMQVIKTKTPKKKKSNSNKVKVAVIDSGVDVVNDLIVWDNINLIPGEEELLPLFSDITGHGTSVAGVIAAEENETGITGINPNVEIYAARVLDNNNQAPISRVVEGIYWAIENDVHIINMSFGTKTDSATLRKAIQDAYAAGILLVAAAGNTGDEVEYPAAYPEVLAVGSIDSDGSVSEKSATGNEIELVAPGEKIKSSAGFGTTLICSGTSMAAPHVTGVASLLWEKDLSMSSEFIRKLLTASANHYNENPEYGYGLIDAEYALSIYNEFKAKYKDTIMEDIPQADVNETVPENTSEMVVYENNDYVEGRWKKATHQLVMGTRTDLESMKEGCVYPDESEYLKGISYHGAFHGRGNHYETRIEDVGNYVANTIYLTKIANAPNLITYQNAGMYLGKYTAEDINEFNSMYNQLSICLTKESNKFKNRREFMWGIAMHCATDAYAHSSFACIRNRWYRVKHPLLLGDGKYTSGEIEGNTVIGADDIYFSLGRWLCAQHVAENMINIYLGTSEETDVSYRTFMVNDYIRAEQAPYDEIHPNANLKFKLYKLYTYASQTEEYQIDERGLLLEKTMHFWK